jgi:outer membrane protein OmpA-like peptidoglycan-associated protein
VRIAGLAGIAFTIACGGEPARATLANQGSGSAADAPPTEQCRALVARTYDPPTKEYVDATGRKVVVTTSDQCGLVIDMIYFQRESIAFRPDIADEVAGMLSCLAQTEHTRMRLDVIGHASSDERDPEAIGLERARAVERYLRACGAPVLGLAARSAGDREPIDRRSTEEARAHNRRVEFQIVDPRRP